MTDSSGSQAPVGLGAAGMDRLTRESSFAPTQAAAPRQNDAEALAFPPTETIQPRPADEAAGGHPLAGPAWRPPGDPAPSAADAASDPYAASAGQTSYQADPDGYPEMRRYGPGVPDAAQAVLSADEIWRTGQLPVPPSRGRWWRRAGSALSVALLIASGVLIYLRLHHGPLTVTAVAITAEQKNGCAVNVTGRIGISGGAGTVFYQWVFTPQAAAPQPLSQAVAAGQSAVYVTAAVQGQGHGTLAQQVTLQVLGPGRGSAAARVTVSC